MPSPRSRGRYSARPRRKESGSKRSPLLLTPCLFRGAGAEREAREVRIGVALATIGPIDEGVSSDAHRAHVVAHVRRDVRTYGAPVRRHFGYADVRFKRLPTVERLSGVHVRDSRSGIF